MSAFAGQPALPDHIEGAHPLLGGEIRFLLFWLELPTLQTALLYHNLLLL